MIMEVLKMGNDSDMLKKSEAMLKGLLENTESALALFDNNGVLEFYNISLRKIIGYGFEEIDKQALYQILGEENLRLLEDAVAKISDEKGSLILHNMKVQHKQGEQRTVRVKLDYIDIDGDGLTLISVMDITAQSKNQEQFLQLSRMKDVVLAINHKLSEDVQLDDFFNYILSRVREVIPHADLGCILMLDEEGFLSMAASFGYLQEESSNFKLPLTQSFAYRFTEGDYSRTVIINNIQFLLDSDYVEMMDNKDGYLVQSSISGPIYKDSKLYGFINIDSKDNNVYTDNDVAIMEYLREQLGLAFSHREMFSQYAYLSKHDQLTGFHNRWYLKEIENEHSPRWRRYFTNVLIVAMDLNDLKMVNDELGHHEGDKYILTFSSAMQQIFRSTDIFMRLGGNEFAGIFFDICEEDLIQKLDQVNRMIEDSELQKITQSIKLGFGYGIVRFGDSTFNVQELMQLADARMYAHKAEIKARNNQNRSL
jgi:diguanylate cyclase (GGDEF)-like protein/PAS domain S-box-containing protein